MAVYRDSKENKTNIHSKRYFGRKATFLLYFIVFYVIYFISFRFICFLFYFVVVVVCFNLW